MGKKEELYCWNCKEIRKIDLGEGKCPGCGIIIFGNFGNTTPS